MRSRPSSKNKLIRVKPTTLLSQQSNKMQNKLLELKKSLNDKKALQKTSQKLLQTKELNSRFAKDIKQFIGPKKEDQLTKFYKDLKMQAYAETLKQAGIINMKQLTQMSVQDIQKLPIPPGYRIKIKKSLMKNMQTGTKVQIPYAKSQQKIVSLEKIQDIEQIILKRQKTKESQRKRFQQSSMFIPLQQKQSSQTNTMTQSFLFQLQKQKQLGNYKQTDKQYLKQYFQIQQKSQPKIPRKCLKQSTFMQPTLTPKKLHKLHTKKVTWQPSISQQSPHKTYPKQTFIFKPLQQIKTNQSIFCWQCYSKISSSKIQQFDKTFCSTTCKNNYHSQMFKQCEQCKKQILKSELTMDLCVECNCPNEKQLEQQDQYSQDQKNKQHQLLQYKVQDQQELDIDLSF